MALSGSFSTNDYHGRKYTCSWTATQSAATNSSTITWSIKAHGGSSNWYAERDCKLVINGTTVFNKTNRVERYASTFATGSIEIPHDTEGNKSFTASMRVACYTWSVNLTGSKSFTLDKIARKALITGADNFNDEENPKITYTNEAKESVESLQACISLDNTSIDIPYRDIDKLGNSYTFELTDEERETLRASITSGTSRTVYFSIRTIIDGATFYSWIAKTFTLVNASPTLAPTVVDMKSASIALTGDKNIIIKGYSDISYSIHATARKGATIVSQSCQCGNKVGTTYSGIIKNAPSNVFIFSATDSRGITTTTTLTKGVVDYWLSSWLQLNTSNPTTDGEMSVEISGSGFNGSFGTVQNEVLLYYKYKPQDGDYTDWIAVETNWNGDNFSGSATITGLDYKKAYSIQAMAVDKLNTTYSGVNTVKSIPVCDWSDSDYNFNVPVSFQEDIHTANGTQLYTINGNFFGVGEEVEAIMLCDGFNSMRVGYGNYNNGVGTTEIYGNNIQLNYNDKLIINGVEFANNKVLWSGVNAMGEGQTITLSEPISQQNSGIVLVFSGINAISGAAADASINTHFVSKYQLGADVFGTGGVGHSFLMNVNAGFSSIGAKYLYFTDTTISGQQSNDTTGTNSGITFHNENFGLRYVIGV